MTELTIKSSNPPPDLPDVDISPVKQKRGAKPKCDNVTDSGIKLPQELELEERAEVAEAKLMHVNGQLLQAQAAVILQRLYCAKVRQQLDIKEKKKDKQDDGGRLEGDLPPLLTSDEQIAQVKRKQDAVKAACKKKAVLIKCTKWLAKAIKQWERADAEHRIRNEGLEAQWKKGVEDWKEERSAAKARGLKLKDWEQTHPCLKKSDPEFKPEPATSKPKRADYIHEDVGESEGEEFDLNVSSEDDK